MKIFTNFSLYLLLTVLLMGSSASAQVKSSQGSGFWTEINWSPAGIPGPEDDAEIQHSLTIKANETVHINSLKIGQSGSLTVNGVLKINGDLTMDNNGSHFTMGPDAIVIVYGNFYASNKVDISISSYLIIYGDFIKGGSSGQGNLDVSDANIYIFGAVTNWDNFGSCDTGTEYDGTTPVEDGECDYGTEEDYEDNQDTFPDDLVDLINCYDLSAITSDATACPGGSAILSVNNSALTDVTYEWQENSAGTWTVFGGNSSSVNVSNITNFDKEYRVVVRPTNGLSCSISISKSVKISAITDIKWTGAINNSWNEPGNWSCNVVPGLESVVFIPADVLQPVIGNNVVGKAKDLHVETGGLVSILQGKLEIGGALLISGEIDATSGSVSFLGSSAQTIATGIFKNNRISNLFINNSAGVSSYGVLEITGTLKVENGTFDTANQLTLISDATQTALIDGSGKGQITGSVSIQRYLDPAFGYKYFSSPLMGTTVGDFAAYVDLNSPFPHAYRYNENRTSPVENEAGVTSVRDATGWETYTDPAGILNPLEGYAFNFGSSKTPVTVEISGEVNNGSYSRSLQNNHREYTKGFNLVGNPYPSPIDWNATNGWTRTNIDDAIYFFTTGTDNQYTGTYSAFVNNISTDPREDGRASNIIPSMQGFFVKVSDGAAPEPVAGILEMTNEVRVVDFNQEFLKTAHRNPKALVRFQAGFINEKLADPLVLYFPDNAIKDFETDKDAHKLMNTNLLVPNFYSFGSKEEKLAISARPLVEQEKIAVGIKAEKSGRMAIELEKSQSMPLHLDIFLLDHEKGNFWNLSQNGPYEFSINAGEHNSRFEIIFSGAEIIEMEAALSQPLQAYSAKGNLHVNYDLENNQNGILQVSTINGQILATKNVQGKSSITFDSFSTPGVYIIILETAKKRFSKKVILRNSKQ